MAPERSVISLLLSEATKDSRPPHHAGPRSAEQVADASGWIPLVQSGQFRLLVVWGSVERDNLKRVKMLAKQ